MQSGQTSVADGAAPEFIVVYLWRSMGFRSTIFMVFLWYMLANKQDKGLIVNNCESNNTLMISQGLCNKGVFSTSRCYCSFSMDADIPNPVVVT
jgi:hypothetical protein